MTEKQPLVSCIIPVFNGGLYLKETLESVLQQNYPHIEIIVVNDGSTDQTPAILEDFSGEITVFHQKNLGQSAARNRGLRAAKGDFVAFLDADDLWHPHKTRIQVEFLRAHPQFSICFTLIRNFWIPELKSEKKRLEKEGKVKLCFPFSPCSFLGSRTVFDRVGEFRTELKRGEDTDLFLRMKNKGIEFEVIPQVLAFRRLHQNNLTRGLYVTSKEQMQQRALEALLSFRKKEAKK